MFKEFQNKVKNQLALKTKMLRSDKGGAYLSLEFIDHLKNYGIVWKLSSPITSKLNGVDERRNQMILGMVRSMMIRATLLISLLGYALE